MPRLKAITTGSVPSFLDVILNLDEADSSSTLASQDTWLAQMKAKQTGKLLMYGDDTWLKLFPDTFDRADGTSSFFVSVYTLLFRCRPWLSRLTHGSARTILKWTTTSLDTSTRSYGKTTGTPWCCTIWAWIISVTNLGRGGILEPAPCRSRPAFCSRTESDRETLALPWSPNRGKWTILFAESTELSRHNRTYNPHSWCFAVIMA